MGNDRTPDSYHAQVKYGIFNDKGQITPKKIVQCGPALNLPELL